MREPSVLLAPKEPIKVAVGEASHGALGEGGEQLEITRPEGGEEVGERHSPEVGAGGSVL